MPARTTTTSRCLTDRRPRGPPVRRRPDTDRPPVTTEERRVVRAVGREQAAVRDMLRARLGGGRPASERRVLAEDPLLDASLPPGSIPTPSESIRLTRARSSASVCRTDSYSARANRTHRRSRNGAAPTIACASRGRPGAAARRAASTQSSSASIRSPASRSTSVTAGPSPRARGTAPAPHARASCGGFEARSGSPSATSPVPAPPGARTPGSPPRQLGNPTIG